MTKGFRLAVPFLVIVLLCTGAGTAWAFPPLPASYYGQVQITDFTVTAADHVLAYVPGVAGSVGDGAIQQYQGGWVYTIDVNGDDWTTPTKDGGIAGDTITFKIGEHVVMQVPWQEGNTNRPIHPPAAALQTNSPVGEGSAVTLDAGASADAGTDVATYAFDCDGNAVFEVGPGMAKTTTCTFINGPSSHTVGVRVVDGQGGVSTKTAGVTVNNVLPVVTLPADAVINEGATFTGSGTFSDPGADTWTATVDYGDGAAAASLGLTGKTFALSHQYADSGAYQISVAVGDGDGSGSQTMQVTANNVAPAATFAATSPINAGGSSMLSFSAATDPSPADLAAGLHYSFVCDGQTSSLATTYAAAQVDTAKTCTFPNTGPYTVRGRILDKDEGYTDYEQTVEVGNVSPVVSITSATASIDEGGAFAGSGSFIHSGDDTCTAEVDYGDGSPASALTLNVNQTFDLAHIYADSGSYTVKVTVTDARGAADEDTRAVTVNNVAPTAMFSAPDGVDEGSIINLSLASPQDPSPDDTTAGFQYAFDCGAGHAGWGSTSSANCPTSGKGTLTVKAKIQDQDGGASEYTQVVQVRDVVPAAAEASGPYASTAGDEVALTGSAQGCLAVDGCTLTWTEGSTVLGTGASLNHRWNRTGLHTVTLLVTDDDGNNSTDTANVTVAGRERTLTLQPGWNLVSFNVIPDDLAVAQVLQSIAGQWDLAYAWDGASQGWRKADNIPGFQDTLTELDEKQGFWVHITAATAVDFPIAGSLPDGDTQIQLFKQGQGWNLVSLPAGADQALSPTAIPNLSMVYQYRADEAMPWRLYDVNAPAWANDLSLMSPLYGYWVKVTGDGAWAVPYGNP